MIRVKRKKSAKGDEGDEGCDWVVRTERPEETCEHPSSYYTPQQIERYARSGAMRRAQEKTAQRILELLGAQKSIKLLDLGCGVGYTTSFYEKQGHRVTGLDVLPLMVQRARSKGLIVVHGDMQELDALFNEHEFDAVVSSSALQWLSREQLVKTAAGIRHVLKPGGKAIIQFYPKSEQQLLLTARAFKKKYSRVTIVIDHAANPRKRTVFLVAQR